MRDIATKQDDVGDELPAAEFNSSQNELENAVTSTDQTLDPGVGADTDLNMLGKSLSMYATGGQYYNDSGVVNAYVLGRSTNLKPNASYKNGQIAIFKAAAANTGASTINVSGLGVKNLTQYDGNVLESSQINNNAYIKTIYNSANDRFELVVSVGDSEFAAGTILTFGNSTAPIGWTRKTDWQDSAMFCYKATGNLSNGGGINPQTAHNHTGPSHTHTMQNHTHVGGDHRLTISEMPTHSHPHNYSIGIGGLNSHPQGDGVFGPVSGFESNVGGNALHNHGNTGVPSNNTTAASGSGNTGNNSAPYFQELIACTKD